MLKAIKNIFSKNADKKIGNGLFVTIEELVEQRKFLKYVRLNRKNPTLSANAGDIKSAFKGRGVELAESRQYIFGDDVRDIDWRLTARKQDPYTKIFHEERDREIYVLLDLSATMVFGSKKELKSVAAAKVASLLGWMSLENADRFGCVIYDGKHIHFYKAQNSRYSLMAIYKKVADITRNILAQKEQHIKLSTAVQMLKKNVKSQPLIFVISDFYDFDEDLKAALAALSRVSKLYCLNVMDVLEEKAPKSGEYMIAYHDQKLVFESGSKAFQKEYYTYFLEKRMHLEEFCKRFNIRYVPLNTGTEIYNQLKLL